MLVLMIPVHPVTATADIHIDATILDGDARR
jgi:hypothetical protein